jgi:hypothetical protein
VKIKIEASRQYAAFLTQYLKEAAKSSETNAEIVRACHITTDRLQSGIDEQLAWRHNVPVMVFFELSRDTARKFYEFVWVANHQAQKGDTDYARKAAKAIGVLRYWLDKSLKGNL